MVLCDWYSWYCTGMVIFILDTLLNRPLHVLKGSVKQLIYYTIAFPVFYIHWWTLDIKDKNTRLIRIFKIICTTGILLSLITIEHRVRSHALEHARLINNSYYTDDTSLLLTDSNLYLEHITPFNQDKLPTIHKIEHTILHSLYSVYLFKPGDDSYADYVVYAELRKAGTVDYQSGEKLIFVIPFILLMVVFKIRNSYTAWKIALIKTGLVSY